ncbi:MAG: M12 family metallo-peptidase [Planctomycetota bacterium]
MTTHPLLWRGLTMLLASVAPVASVHALQTAVDAPHVALFPMELVHEDGPLGSFDFEPNPEAIRALQGHASVSMPGVPLPDGTSVILDLNRVSFDFDSMGIHVDGEPARWDSGDLSLWTGTVLGDPFSEVTLGFSTLGTYGWISTAGEIWHISAHAQNGRTWDRPGCQMWAESVSADYRENSERPSCLADMVSNGFPSAVPTPMDERMRFSGGTQLSECKVSIETDFQLFQLFGNLNAQQNYMAMLLAAISNRFETEVDVVLTYPYVMFHTTQNDGWTTADTGGNTVDMLFEFRDAWENNIPAGGHLGHFISGANLGGGVAWLDTLCNGSFGFAVSANLGAAVNFPVMQGSGNWDFYVICHELGHNFASPHTHDYCPPLDECAPSNLFGQCQSQRNCTNQGTIMSYCHLCNGGVTNITTFFHPTVQQRMRDAVAVSCLPPWNGGCATDALEDNDDCSQAIAIGGGTTGNLTVSNTDADFYSVMVEGGATLTVTALFAHADADVDLYLYDPVSGCGSTGSALASSTSNSNNESLSFQNASLFDATYVVEVRVDGSSSGACAPYSLDVDPGQGITVGEPYCGPAATNSVGLSGRIVATGSSAVSANDVTLNALNLPPGSLGYFLVSANSGLVQNPGGSTGVLCLLPPFGRYVAFAAAVAPDGTMTLPIDLGALPQPTGTVSVQPGETWYFQLWHRDSFLGVATSNFTDGVGVLFD